MAITPISIVTLDNMDDINAIDCCIDDIIKKHSANSELMSLMALEATAFATSVSARSKNLENQGFLGRLFGSITVDGINVIHII